MKDIFGIDFNNLAILIKEMKCTKEISDPFFLVNHRILEILNNLYLRNKIIVLNEVKNKIFPILKIKKNYDIDIFSSILFKYILIYDFLPEKIIYIDKLGCIFIKIKKLYFDFSSDNIKLIDKSYYFDKYKDFMISQKISRKEYLNSWQEVTEIDLLAGLIVGSFYNYLSIDMPNSIELRESILKSFKNKNLKNHNYHCTLLLSNIYNKKVFNELYQKACSSSLSCNNHFLAKIIHGIIFMSPLEEINEAIDLYIKYSTFQLNMPDSLSEKIKIASVNILLYCYALIKGNNEIANEAFEKIKQFDIGLEIPEMTKTEARSVNSLIRSSYKILKAKKTSSFINFLVWFIKIVNEDESHEKEISLEDICMLLNESPLTDILNEKFEKNSFIVMQIMEKLK